MAMEEWQGAALAYRLSGSVCESHVRQRLETRCGANMLSVGPVWDRRGAGVLPIVAKASGVCMKALDIRE